MLEEQGFCEWPIRGTTIQLEALVGIKDNDTSFRWHHLTIYYSGCVLVGVIHFRTLLRILSEVYEFAG